VSFRTVVLAASLSWVILISGLHAWLNLDLFRKSTGDKKPFKVGFLPVT
jgi:hypothetical protein